MMGGHSTLYKVEQSQQTALSWMGVLNSKPRGFLFHIV